MPNTLRERRRRGAVIAVSTLLALALVELGLRSIGGVFHDRFTQPDADRGWSLRPGFGGWVKDERVLWLQVNDDGLLDREHPRIAPPHTLRVAVLGDSYVQGLNLPAEDRFTTVLEQRLTACVPAPRRVEVMNFGVSGYGTAQAWLTYTLHAAKYRPDVVVLAVYTNNDIHNNHRRLNPTEYADHSPYFTLVGNELTLDASFRQVLAASADQPRWRRVRIWFTEHLRVAQLVHEVYGQLRAMAASPAEGTAATDDPETPDESVYVAPTTPEMIDAWRVTEALVLAWVRDVRRAGAEPWIVTLANAAQVDPDVSARRRLASTLGVDSLFYPDRRIHDLASRHGVSAVLLAEPMADYAASAGVYLHGGYREEAPPGSGHWNERGSAIAAQLTAARLCADSTALRPPP